MRQRSGDDRADLVIVRIAFRAARALESAEVVHDLLCSRAHRPVGQFVAERFIEEHMEDACEEGRKSGPQRSS